MPSVPLQHPDLFVIIRILDSLWRSESPPNRTRLQTISGVNYTQFQRYLELLVQRGLIEELSGAGSDLRLRLTPKGYDALVFLAGGLRKVFGNGDLTAGGPARPGR